MRKILMIKKSYWSLNKIKYRINKIRLVKQSIKNK